MPNMNESFPDIRRAPLILPASLEAQRGELEESLAAAQSRIENFALENGWMKHAEKIFIERVEIYDDHEKYRQAVVKFLGMAPAAEFPKTYSACLERNVLFMVSPRLYAKNYPEGREKDSYEKLIAHEMAHRLHVGILGGYEDAMGPVWFYEGFAVYASGQFEGSAQKLSPSEMRVIMANPKRGSYKKYGALFRYLLTQTSLQELLKHAVEKGFMENLIEN